MMQEDIKSKILRVAKEECVKYIRLQFTDMLGTIKSVEIPVSKLKDAIDGKIMFDGSSIEGFVRIKEADMYLHPDLTTFLILPLESSQYGKVARFFCDVYLPNGEVFKGDPRANLKRIVKQMEEERGLDRSAAIADISASVRKLRRFVRYVHIHRAIFR